MGKQRKQNKILIVVSIGIFFSMAVFFLDCGKRKEVSEVNVLAKVGDRIITDEDFRISYELWPRYSWGTKGMDAKWEHLNTLIEKKLVALEGIRRGIDQQEPIRERLKWYQKKAAIEQLYKREISENVEITEAEAREAFLKYNEKIRARHLFAETLDEALKLRDRLLAGERFEDVAAEIFTDPTLRANGGDLGFFTWGEMDEDFEKAAFSLMPGELSEPVKTRWGYHIIKVEERHRNAIITEYDFYQKKNHIDFILKRRKEEKLSRKYIKDFMDDKKVVLKGKPFGFLVRTSREKLGPPEQPIPPYLPKLLDREIGEVKEVIEDHLDEVLVTFEGGHWTIGDFFEKLRPVPPSERPLLSSFTGLKNGIGVMVRDEFLAKAAFKKGLHHSDEAKTEVQKQQEDILFGRLKTSILDTVTVTEGEMLSYFQQNRDDYDIPEMVNVREIFVRDRSTAEDLLSRIKAGEDMAALAREYTLRTWVKDKGGEFGYFPRGRHGEIGRLAFSHQAGDLVGPIEIAGGPPHGGYSIFKVIGRKDSQEKSFEEVRDEVQKDKFKKKKKAVWADFVASLRDRYPVEVDEDLLTSVPVTDTQGRPSPMVVIRR
ncbi:peptidylprolyl isomerase [candidate division KSB1 bacterium]|nr:peptidylprolyl isomerase [candidate division KSB1 bacterium]